MVDPFFLPRLALIGWTLVAVFGMIAGRIPIYKEADVRLRRSLILLCLPGIVLAAVLNAAIQPLVALRFSIRLAWWAWTGHDVDLLSDEFERGKPSSPSLVLDGETHHE